MLIQIETKETFKMASRGINKVIVLGNVGKDPEIKYMPNGSAVANLSIATSESYKDKNTGQPVDKTEWHKIVIFGKLAEICGEYVRKGTQLFIEGKLQTRKWQDQQGQDKYTTEIVVDGFNGQMQMVGGKGDQASQSVNNQQSQQGNFNQQQQQGSYNQQQNNGFASQQNQGGFAPQQQGNFNQQQQQPQQFQQQQPQQGFAPQQNQGGFAPQQQGGF